MLIVMGYLIQARLSLLKLIFILQYNKIKKSSGYLEGWRLTRLWLGNLNMVQVMERVELLTLVSSFKVMSNIPPFICDIICILILYYYVSSYLCSSDLLQLIHNKARLCREAIQEACLSTAESNQDH